MAYSLSIADLCLNLAEKKRGYQPAAWLDEEDSGSVVKAAESMCFTLTETAVKLGALEPMYSGLELKATFQKSGSYVSRTI